MSDEKMTVTREELVKTLLQIREKFEDRLRESFKVFVKKSDEFNFEIKILSLWILTVKIENDEVLDLMHRNFYKKNNWDQEEVDIFRKRYESYFYALNRFTKNPNQGFQFGNLILGNLCGGKINEDNCNILDSISVFSLVMELIKAAGKTLEGIEIEQN